MKILGKMIGGMFWWIASGPSWRMVSAISIATILPFVAATSTTAWPNDWRRVTVLSVTSSTSVVFSFLLGVWRGVFRVHQDRRKGIN